MVGGGSEGIGDRSGKTSEAGVEAVDTGVEALEVLGDGVVGDVRIGETGSHGGESVCPMDGVL